MTKQNGQKAQHALKPNTMLLDRYIVKEVLGQNGLSIIYKAYDTLREKVIALKELYPSAIVARNFDDGLNVECVQLSNERLFEQMKNRCIQKAKKMIKLYPLSGMANIICYIEANQTVYLVMQYVEGIDLPTFFKRKHSDRLELNKAVRLLKPVLDSLEKIHRAGIFHGRISPESIILTERRQAILLGFGDPMEEVAQDVLGETTARALAFAPVEQYVPGGMQGEATDVYAIAAVIYYCITGIRPPAFYDRVAGVTGEKDPLVSPWDLKVRVMKRQSDAIMKALAVYTFDRYQSVREFIGALDLDQFGEEEDQQIVFRARLPLKYRKKMRRKRIVAAAVTVTVVVLLLLFVPRAYRYYIHLDTAEFYQALGEKNLYEKCVALSGLSEKEKSRYGNNYEIWTEEGGHEIHYFDLNKNKLVAYEEAMFEEADYSFLCLDFRTGNRAIMSFVTPQGRQTYECRLTKQGSYYEVEYAEDTDGKDRLKEQLSVSAEQPEGKEKG